MVANPKTDDIATHVRKLAAQHHVAYRPGPRDALANDITRLAGDEVTFGEIDFLLIALTRAGVVPRNDAVRMIVQHRRQVHP